jgi:hypothetical protein
MKKLVLYVFTVFIPAIIVGISNYFAFPDAFLMATLMLLVTAGVAGVFTYFSGDAIPKVRRYCIIADLIICLILCLNLGAHWLLAREVSAARQGVEERHSEEDREEIRKASETERQLALKKADADLLEKERRRLRMLPVGERHSTLQTPKVESTPKVPLIAPMSLVPPGVKMEMAPRMTPEQVRQSWWWKLTALAFAETFASVLAGALLTVAWEWDRNHDGVPDRLQNLERPPGRIEGPK